MRSVPLLAKELAMIVVLSFLWELEVIVGRRWHFHLSQSGCVVCQHGHVCDSGFQEKAVVNNSTPFFGGLREDTSRWRSRITRRFRENPWPVLTFSSPSVPRCVRSTSPSSFSWAAFSAAPTLISGRCGPPCPISL